MFTPFESLPAHSRVWIYQSDRKFNSQETDIISDVLTTFTNRWAAHGVPLPCSFDIRFNQFIVLAADEISVSASGCSIDDSVHAIKDLGNRLSVDFFNRTRVAFKLDEAILLISLTELKKQYELGVWSGQTLFIDNLVNTKGDLDNKWLVPASSTWLKRYIPQKTVAG